MNSLVGHVTWESPLVQNRPCVADDLEI